MPASKPKRIPTRAQVVGYASDTPEATERLLSDLVDQAARTATLPRVSRTVDLVVGSNRIVHNLGRKPIGMTLTPTVADATFAWSMSNADARTVVVTVVGVAQPGAELEFH